MTPPRPATAPLPPTLWVQADRDGLVHCMTLTEAVCQRLALSGDDTHAVCLAVEEACANVVNHGYRHHSPGPLGLEFQLPSPDLLQAHIHDRAPPFHPDQAPAPDLLAGVDDRPIGGLGWMLIRQTMPPVRYTSQPQGNTLVLQRQLALPVA